MMTKERHAVYEFLQLSYCSQVAIADKLLLIEDGDGDLSNDEFLKRVLRRAKNRGQWQQLLTEIESENSKKVGDYGRK